MDFLSCTSNFKGDPSMNLHDPQSPGALESATYFGAGGSGRSRRGRGGRNSKAAAVATGPLTFKGMISWDIHGMYKWDINGY